MNFARVMAIVAITVFVWMFAAPSASAHASLIASDPADGTLLLSQPQSLTLKFTEPVRPLIVRLIHPGGHTDVLPNIGERGDAIVIALPTGLEQGTHILSWRAVSSDGHPIGGGLVFSIGVESAVAALPKGQIDPIVRIGLWGSRFILLLSLIFGVGSGAFSIFIVGDGPPSFGRANRRLLLSGALAAPALIGFQGLDALGLPVSALPGADVWLAGLFATSFGRATLLAATAIVLAYAAGHTGRWIGVALILLALLTLGLAIAGAGHAATAPPQVLTRPALFLHAVTAALWLGALPPLAGLFASRSSRALPVLQRFSVAIPVVVGFLILSGLSLAMVQLHAFSALWTTNYGLVLLAKLTLVATLLALAAFNRYRLTTPVLTGHDTAAMLRLRRNILLEVVIGSLIIAILGLWRFTPPPRVLALAPALQEIRVSKDGVDAFLSINPSVTGPVVIEMRDLMVDGKPLEPLSVSIDLDKPSYGIGPFTRQAQKFDGRRYRAQGFVLPLDGFWVVRATVLVSEFRSVTLTDIFDVAKPASDVPAADR